MARRSGRQNPGIGYRTALGAVALAGALLAPELEAAPPASSPPPGVGSTAPPPEAPGPAPSPEPLRPGKGNRRPPGARRPFVSLTGPDLDRLDRYLAAAGALVVALDPRGRVEFINPHGCEVLGHARADLVGRDWFDTCVPPDERARVRTAFDALQRGELTQVDHFEHELLTAAGERRTVRWSDSVARDAGGRVTGTVGIGVDITEQRRAEEALREREREWATLVGNLPGAVYRCALDAGFTTTFVTDGIHAITGYRPAELIEGRVRYLDLVDPEDLERVRAEVERSLPLRRPFRIVYRLRHRDGTERWVWEQGVGVVGADGGIKSVEGFLTDVTEQRRTEETARHMESHLAHAERLATMGELATGLAHELGQPLFAVANYARAGLRRLREGDAKPEDLAADLEDMLAQATRAQAIVRGMRDFVRKGEPRVEAADVNAVVADALHLVQAEVRRAGARVRLELARGLPPVAVNRVQIVQVVVNLVRNGIEAMAGAGVRPEVRVTTGPGRSGGVAVSVTDGGPGIAHGDADRLFEPFFTTKPDGMGMGLAISRSLVESHGGHIRAASAPDGGTTFRFVLPAGGSGPRADA